MREKIPPFRIGTELTRSRMEQLRRSAAREVTADAPLAVSQTPGGWAIAHRPHPRTWWVGIIDSGHTDFSDARYRVRLRRLVNSDAGTSDLLRWFKQQYPYSDTVVVENLAEESSNTHCLALDRKVLVYPVEDDSLPTKRRWVMDTPPPLCVNSSYHPTYSDENWEKAKSSDVTGIGSNSDHWHVLGHMYQDSDTRQMNPWFVIDPDKMFCTSDPDDFSAVDKTGTGSTGGHWYAKGYMYQDTDGKMNPVVVIDPTDSNTSDIDDCGKVFTWRFDKFGRLVAYEDGAGWHTWSTFF